MWSYRYRGPHWTDEARGEGVWTPEYYVTMMAEKRARGVIPVSFLIGLHPDDRAVYAPLIAAAEDDARRHGDVQVQVVEDERYARV